MAEKPVLKIGPVEALYAYHQQLSKRLAKGIEDNPSDTIISAVLEEMGVIATKGNTKTAYVDLYKRIIIPARANFPALIPIIDGNPTTWEEFEAFLRTYVDQPLIVQTRLGLSSDISKKVVGGESRSGARVASTISKITGKRNQGSEVASSITEEVNKFGASIQIKIQKQANDFIMDDPEEYYDSRVLSHIQTNLTSIKSNGSGNKASVLIELLDADGLVVEKYLLKSKVNPGVYAPDPIVPTSIIRASTLNPLKATIFPVDVLYEDGQGMAVEVYYDIGHKESELTKRLKVQLGWLEANLDTAEKAAQNSSITDSDTIKRYKDLISGYKNKIARHKDFIKDSELLDKTEIKLDTALQGTKLTPAELQEAILQINSMQGKGGILLVSKVDTKINGSNIVVTETADVSTNIPALADYMVEYIKLNLGKSGKAASIARQATASLLNPQSTSPFVLLLYKELSKIFNEPAFFKQAKQNMNKGNTITSFAKAPKTNIKGKKIKPLPKETKPGKKLNNKSKLYSSSYSSKVPKLQGTQDPNSILSTLNANIREYVLAEMGSNSLHNRTGRFAGSVQILDYETNPKLADVIRFTYLKSPYMVFSQRVPSNPWNRNPERDPAKIIDRAIKQMGARFLHNTAIITEER
jgi:hypothetical protein